MFSRQNGISSGTKFRGHIVGQLSAARSFQERIQGAFQYRRRSGLANLGWKNDTVYFENLDHWFAFVPKQKYLSKEAAQSYTVQALAEATVAVFSQNSYVVDDIRTSELEQSGDTLRQSVQIKLVNETVGCSKSSPCRIVFTSHFSENEPMKPADWVVQTQKLDDGKHWKFWATSFESDLKQTPASEQTRLWESVSEKLPNGFSLYLRPDR